MSPSQTKLYWREWAAVRRACKAAAIPDPDRHALHLRALGGAKSSKLFTNADFDQVLAEFRAISQPANVTGQVRQLKQPRARMEMSLEEIMKCLALYVGDVDAYAARVCLDKFHTPDWRDLSEQKHPQKSNPRKLSSQLDQFQWTLSERLNKAETGLRNQAGDTLHTMKLKAGVECHCAKICGKLERGTPVPRADESPEPALQTDGDDNNEPW